MVVAELDKLLEDTPIPMVAQHAAKLSGVRKRVASLMSTLRVIQGRIINMDRMLNARGRLSPPAYAHSVSFFIVFVHVVGSVCLGLHDICKSVFLLML